MFKETEELCKAANIMDKDYSRMGNKFTGRKIKMTVSPSNLNNIQEYLAEILAEDIRQMCIKTQLEFTK